MIESWLKFWMLVIITGYNIPISAARSACVFRKQIHVVH